MVASTGLSHKVVSPPHNDSQQDCPIRIRERSIAVSLQNHAFTALSAAGFALLRHQGGARSMFEHLTDTLVRLCGTLQVFVGTNLLADLLTLLNVLAFASKHGYARYMDDRCLTCSGVTGFWLVL